MTSRGRGIVLVLSAGACWASESLWVRLTGAGDWQILFWSSTLMAVALSVWLLRIHRGGILAAIRATGRPGVVAAISLALAYSGYILALSRTSVANTVVLMATAPLFAALLARLVLGERVQPRTAAAMAVAFAGILVMVSDSSGGGRFLGDMIALATGVLFAVNLVALRAAPLRDGAPVDMMPSNAMAGLLIAGVAIFLDAPFAVAGRDVPLLLLIGLVSMALGTWLFTRGVRHLQAAEAGLLCLSETVLAPLLVWAVLRETPTPQELAGALIVLAALALDTLPERRRAETPAPPG